MKGRRLAMLIAPRGGFVNGQRDGGCLDNAVMGTTSIEDDRRALLVEDDAFTRGLLTTFLESIGYSVLAAGSANDALDGLEQFDPDVALVDLELGEGPSGVDVVIAVHAIAPWAATVLMSSHRSIELVHAHPALPTSHFQFAIKSELDSTAELERVILAATHNVEVNRRAPNSAVRLTSGQAELLRLLAQGLSNDEIARVKQVNLKSVERMLARLYRTLEVPSHPGANARVEAASMYRTSQVVVR